MHRAERGRRDEAPQLQRFTETGRTSNNENEKSTFLIAGLWGLSEKSEAFMRDKYIKVHARLR